MILFVFEGERREIELYKTIERLYFPKNNDSIICSFGNNIYDLYKCMKELDWEGDIVAVMKERLLAKGDTLLNDYKSSDISQAFLFFDYDFQNAQLPLDELNRRMGVMLDKFSDETENGRLYINYPMVESIRYVKGLPDEEYWRYKVSRKDCRKFKSLAADFSSYKSLDFITSKNPVLLTEAKSNEMKANWEILKEMNVCKANYIISGEYAFPVPKEAIDQKRIFFAQLEKFVYVDDSVSILNAFPLFLYEYFKH